MSNNDHICLVFLSFLTTEKLDVFTWKKRVLPCGENFPGVSKECTAISAKNNGQRHCRPAAESEMALTAKSHHSKSEVIHDHENNDNEEEFDDNLIFADGKDVVNFELFSQSCNVIEIIVAVFCSCFCDRFKFNLALMPNEFICGWQSW